jgi:hypothetical protein
MEESKLRCALLSANRSWFCDQNGKPLAGYWLCFFDMQTSSPADVYSGPGKGVDPDTDTVSLGPRIQLDASGFARHFGIWLDISKKYRMEVCKNIRRNPITDEIEEYEKDGNCWDIDNLPSITENIRFDVAASGTAETLSLSPNSDFAFMCISGYYRKDDGGGGVFYWDMESMDNHDGGMVFAPNPNKEGRWKRLLHGRVLHSAYYGAHAHAGENGASAFTRDRWNAMMDFAKKHDLTVYADGADGREEGTGNLFSMKFHSNQIRFDAPVVLDPLAIFDDYADSRVYDRLTINDENIHFADATHIMRFECDEIKTSWFSPGMDFELFLKCAYNVSKICVNSSMKTSQDLRIDSRTILLQHLDGNSKKLTFRAKPEPLRGSVINATIKYTGPGSEEIKLSDWFSSQLLNVSVKDDTFDWEGVRTLVCDRPCELSLNQPRLTVVAAAKCSFNGSSHLYDARAEAGGQFKAANGAPADGWLIDLSSPSLVIDGNAWDRGQRLPLAASATQSIAYTGNFDVSGISPFLNGTGRSKFRDAFINCQGDLQLTGNLIEMRDTTVVCDSIVLNAEATLLWDGVTKRHGYKSARLELVCNASKPYSFNFIAKNSTTSDSAHELCIPEDSTCRISIENCQFEVAMSQETNSSLSLTIKDSTFRSFELRQSEIPRYFEVKDFTITGCKFLATISFYMESLMATFKNCRITGNDFAFMPNLRKIAPPSFAGASASPLYLIGPSSTIDMYDNTVKGSEANVPTTRLRLALSLGAAYSGGGFYISRNGDVGCGLWADISSLMIRAYNREIIPPKLNINHINMLLRVRVTDFYGRDIFTAADVNFKGAPNADSGMIFNSERFITSAAEHDIGWQAITFETWAGSREAARLEFLLLIHDTDRVFVNSVKNVNELDGFLISASREDGA